MKFFNSLWRGWLKVAHTIGRVNTILLLTLFYVFFIGIARVVTYLLRKDLLDRRFRDRPIYWKVREGFTIDRKEFLKPY